MSYAVTGPVLVRPVSIRVQVGRVPLSLSDVLVVRLRAGVRGALRPSRPFDHEVLRKGRARGPNRGPGGVGHPKDSFPVPPRVRTNGSVRTVLDRSSVGPPGPRPVPSRHPATWSRFDDRLDRSHSFTPRVRVFRLVFPYGGGPFCDVTVSSTPERAELFSSKSLVP